MNVNITPASIQVNVGNGGVSASLGQPVARDYVQIPAYEGPYSVTPSEEAQTLSTEYKRMTDDVSIGSIPSDYVGSEVPRQTAKTVTPTESEQTAVDSGTYTTGEVSVGAIPSDYVGSGITRDPSLTRNDDTVTAPTGYYTQAQSETIPAAVAPQVTMSASPQTPTVDANGLVTATVGTTTGELNPFTSAGYVGTNFKIPYKRTGGSKTLQLDTQAAATITPTESEQTAVASGKYTTGEVKVGAISSSYVGSGVTRNDSTDLSVSGATVTAPAGYYAESASASVPNATWRNASTVGVVPEISVDSSGLITANCAGWTSIHPLTASGYADADTAANIQLSGVKTSQLSTQAAATITPSESEQTAVAVGKFTTGAVKVGAIPSNYVGSSVPTQTAQTITPTTADQTIASGTYLTGTQTVKGDANLLAENIKKDVTIFNVVGTHESGLLEDTLLKALRNQVTSVEDDTLTSIRSYGLAYMTALTHVSFPALQTINTYAFYNDTNLVMNGWQFPAAKTISNYAFRYCYGLTGEVVLPSTVTSIGQYSFASCKNITKFTATGTITTLGTYTFVGASADHKMTVREIHLPNLGTGIALNLNFGHSTAANACQQLELCDIGKAKSIAANTFANCYKLQTLIMRRTSVTTCANVNAFLNTPLRGHNGLTATIYVPNALIDSYKAASVWSTINGYGYVEWKKIEGSPYEL